MHHVGGSEGRLGHDRFNTFYKVMNLYYKKNFGRASLRAVAALNVTVSLLRLVGLNALAALSPARQAELETRAPYFRCRIEWYHKKSRGIKKRQ